MNFTFARSTLILAVSVLSFFRVIGNVGASDLPAELQEARVTEHPGAVVPIHDLEFRDETGKSVRLDQYFHGNKPVLLTLVYFQCPNLCNFVMNGMVDGLKKLDWVPGREFEMVTVSIDPHETPALASVKKKAYLESFGKPVPADGWHFLTSPTEAPLKALAGDIGFGYRWDAAAQQFAHSSVIFMLTPDGRISRYLYGVQFRPTDLKLGLLEASSGKIGTVIDRILLFCYRYDPETRRYSLFLTRVMRAGSAGTVVFFGAYMAAFWRRQRRHDEAEDPAEQA